MSIAKFRPCIDLHDGRVKQIVGSSLSDSDATLKVNFDAANPSSWYAQKYRADNLVGGHVIMLGAGNEAAAKSALNAWPNGLQVGGGINSSNAQMWLDEGAAQVIVTSFIFANGELKQENLEEIYRVCGREKLVLDLSCRQRDGRYWIVTDRWQKFTQLELNSQTLKMLSDYAVEFLIHAVDVEGKQAGIDIRLLELLSEYSPIKSVYAGGISSLDDITTIESYGKGNVDYTVGSGLDLFGGNIRYQDLITKFSRR